MRIIRRETKPVDSKRRVVLPKEFVSNSGTDRVEITLYDGEVIIKKKQ